MVCANLIRAPALDSARRHRPKSSFQLSSVFKFFIPFGIVLAVYAGFWPKTLTALGQALPFEVSFNCARLLIHLQLFWVMIALTLTTHVLLWVGNIYRIRSMNIFALTTCQLIQVVSYVPGVSNFSNASVSFGICATVVLWPFCLIATVYPFRESDPLMGGLLVWHVIIYMLTMCGVAGMSAGMLP